jgi:hypothetical protein
MLYDAITEYKKNGKASREYVTRSVAAVISAMVLNSLLKSIVTAGRDKDEEKNYSEKYLTSFVKNLADDPAGMIPYVNSIVSIFKGYEPIRPDMQLFQNLYYAAKKIGNDKYTPAQKIKEVVNAIAPLFNVPLRNVTKDIEMVWSNGIDALEGAGLLEEKTDYEKLKLKYPSIDNSAATGKFYDSLYQAKQSGDTKLYNQIYSDLIKAGKKPSDIDNAIQNRKREGLFKRTKNENYTNPTLEEAFKAYLSKNVNAYSAARKSLIGEGFTISDIDWAINQLKTEKAKSEAPTAQEFIDAYKTGNKNIWKPMYDKMRVAGWSQESLVKLTK